MVRDALVVSAGRHRDHADSDDDTNDSGGHDAASAADAARLDAKAAGHVFCLTALMKDERHDAR